LDRRRQNFGWLGNFNGGYLLFLCGGYRIVCTMVMRSNKFRFYPTAEQEAFLRQMFGAARWVWNTSLAYRSHAYKAHGESVTGVDFSRELTFLKKLEPYAWLKDVPAGMLVQSLRDQDKAFANFFAKRASYPKFKKRNNAQSIRFQLDQRVVMNNFSDGEMLKLPKLGALNVRWSRKVSGVPKMVTVRINAAGRYFVSMMAETEIQPMPQKTNAVGLDFGLKDVVVTDTGWKSGNARHFRNAERKLKRAQRALSRKTKGSNRRKAAVAKVARLHAKVADARADWLHKLSTDLVRDHGLIAIEDLNVKGMARGRLAKSIGDAGLSELRRQLTYKAEWYGRELVVIDRFTPTSKVCSECGSAKESMPLHVRTWVCSDCGTEHDRDTNAARNILALATGGRPESYGRGAVHKPNTVTVKAAA